MRGTVVVIGAGLGGLAAAAMLTRAGRRVIVVERHEEPGGFAVTFRRAGFHFDASLHHLDAVGVGQANRPLLDRLGISDSLRLHRDPILRRDCLPGIDLLIPQDGATLLSMLADRFPGEAPGLRLLFARAAEVHAALYAGRPTAPGPGSAADLLGGCLGSARLIDLVGGICEYAGRTPAGCPANTFLMLFHAYHVLGGWRLQGGSRALTEALVRQIEVGGGSVRTSSAATAIRLARGRIAAVHLEGGEVIETADVIAALPVPRLADLLPGDTPFERWRTRIATLPPSRSTYRLSVGLHGDHTAGQTYETRIVDDAGQCVVTLPSVGDAGWAEPGNTSVCITMSAPTGVPTAAEREAATTRLLGALNRLVPGADRHVVVSTLAHPGTWARYTDSPGGATMGSGADPVPARTPIPGLTLAGAWVSPGPGQTAVLHSGARAALLVEAGA